MNPPPYPWPLLPNHDQHLPPLVHSLFLVERPEKKHSRITKVFLPQSQIAAPRPAATIIPFTIICALAAPDDAKGGALIVAVGGTTVAPPEVPKDVLLADELGIPVPVAKGAPVSVVPV